MCVLSVVFLLSACSKERDLSVSRPCIKYEQEVAEAKTKEELKGKITAIVEKRVGCQEAAQFSLAFVTALYQEKVQTAPESLKAFGEQYCKNNYENSQAAKDALGSAEKKRLRRKSEYMLEGCRVGIAESLTHYPQFTKLFIAKGVSEEIISDEKDTRFQKAFSRASALSEQMGVKREAISLAANRQSRLFTTQQELRETQARLISSKQAIVTAQARAEDLESRKEAIFAAEKNGIDVANATIAKREKIETRVRPLALEYNRAHQSRTFAHSAKVAAALELSRRKNEIGSLRGEAGTNRSRASSMRSEASSTY